MQKVIPKQIEIYCDRCNILCTDSKHQAKITKSCSYRDYMWEYHSVPDKTYDLCDVCFEKIDKLLGGE